MTAFGTGPSAQPACTLGLDAGGTGTRFCLWRIERAGDGRGSGPAGGGGVLAQGTGRPLSGTMLATEAGRAGVDVTLGAIARALPELPQAVVAGVSGYDGQHAEALLPRLMQIFGVPAPAASAMSDIELQARAAFPGGDGIVVVAGTGSAAALLDVSGEIHRVGGRGAAIDDAGGGPWIAREALRQLWRAEDEEPGAWQRSPLGHAIFGAVGGTDWAATRAWVYERAVPDRAALGDLAMAVAAAAAKDAAALAILEHAGRELARLVLALLRRFGRHPVALTGRVFELHPAVERALVAALPAGTETRLLRHEPAQAAARLAQRLVAASPPAA